MALFDNDTGSPASLTALGSRIVVLTSSATAGAGTPESPWTGWSSAFSELSTAGVGTISVTSDVNPQFVTGVGTTFTDLREGQYLQVGGTFGRVSSIVNDLSCVVESWTGPTASGATYKVYTAAAVYAPSGDYGSATDVNIAYPALHLFGDGPQVTRFHFTGTGRGFVAEMATGAYNLWGVYLEDFSVQGNASITECIYTNRVTRLYMRSIEAWDCSNAAIRSVEAIIGKLENIKVSRNVLTTGTEPDYGLLLEDCTCIHLDSPVIEGMMAGTGVMFGCSWGKITNGTIENNLVNVHVDGSYNSVDTVDLEAGSTTTHSARITGGDFNEVRNCTGMGILEVYQSGINTPWNTRIVGGLWNQITIGALCKHTVIANLKYNYAATGAITDNGTNTHYVGTVADAQSLALKTNNFEAISAPTITATTSVTISDGASDDVQLVVDDAGTLELRDGTGAAALRIYALRTDASNYERGYFAWNANVFQMGTAKAGTGTVRDVSLAPGAVTGFGLDATNPHPRFPVSHKRVTTQFNKTNTTLENITGLTYNVTAGKKYRFRATLYTTSDVGGGVKAAIAGTATATSIIYEAVTYNAGALATIGTSRATAMGTAVGDVTAVTVARIEIVGTIVVNAAGTLTCQFAENAAVATSSVLVNSDMQLWEIAA